MKNKIPWISFLPLVLILFQFFTGCAILGPITDPAMNEKARHLTAYVKSQNQDIKSSKGTGWIELDTKTQKEKLKIAWAASGPNKLRITFLVSGHPVETIVATGKKVTFISHAGRHKPHTIASNNPDLKKFIHVPVKLSEMIAILLGHIPLQEFDHAMFESMETQPSTIVLKKNWKSSVQKIHMNKNGQIQRILSLDSKGAPAYDITYLDYRFLGLNNIPVALKIQDSLGRKIHITLTRFIPNPPLKESIFKLTESGS
ncbi:MAG: hypothetical protein B6230_00020 [Desulfobacteraceae bacterium 4572_89]|nr:MAG: hypothetical protein B6230_00020 [Desulfobacteraceae bacterium 4572_89]